MPKTKAEHQARTALSLAKRVNAIKVFRSTNRLAKLKALPCAA